MGRYLIQKTSVDPGQCMGMANVSHVTSRANGQCLSITVLSKLLWSDSFYSPSSPNPRLRRRYLFFELCTVLLL